MERCDAIIIGGGPAGSTCAWKLRSAGLDVVVMDKREFPRDKTCAGWITPAVVRELELDPADYVRGTGGRKFQPITGFRTGMIGGRCVETNYSEPVSFGIRRCEFDDYLLRRSGTRLCLGEKIESVERSGPGWVINGSIAAPLLIGAGGHFCPVARHLNPGAAGGEVAVVAQEIEFELTPEQASRCAVRADTPELYFCADLRGYAWCFRKESYLNIGLGREDKERLGEHVAEFVGLMKSRGRIPPDTPAAMHGHAYILYGHTRRRLVSDGVVLIGDAAGLAYPESGEGIRPAVESALIAAGVIAAVRGDYSMDGLRPYAARITERFGKPQPRAATVAPVLRGLYERAAAALLSQRWFARHVLIDRWFLHRHQPALGV